MTSPRYDLRTGITDPVILMISRRQVEQGDMNSVLGRLKILTAAREDVWRYRGQMSLVVDGYDEDPRELIDIPQVRNFLREFSMAWPYWGFFFNQIDDSLMILGACVCGKDFPGAGTVEMDVKLLEKFVRAGFDGMNKLFDKHHFPEAELETMSRGLGELFEQARLGLN